MIVEDMSKLDLHDKTNKNKSERNTHDQKKKRKTKKGAIPGKNEHKRQKGMCKTITHNPKWLEKIILNNKNKESRYVNVTTSLQCGVDVIPYGSFLR